MEITWRWFGKKDKITLDMLRQIGVEGIVTALHDIPNGQIWTSDAISELKSFIESFGLRWSVVESLPVSEAIKYGDKTRDKLIDNYIQSLENLGKAGIRTVCYNFMPVLDWARTDLAYLWSDGSSSLYFSKAKFAYFDIHILMRKDAHMDYSTSELAAVEQLQKNITAEEKAKLIDTLIVRTQGFVNGNLSEEDNNPVDKFRQLLSLYDGIDRNQLRENMKYFLEKIIPVCEQYEIGMCVHPDDPPFSLFGLPRIVTSGEDIAWILNTVDHPSNGLTFCTGSLSAGTHNDVKALAKQFASRTKFLHLRSTETFPNGDFIEADHLKGRAHIIDIVRIFEQINPGLPMRVDHGKTMLGDQNKGYNPGYSFHGRMLAVGQLQGVIATTKHQLGKQS